MGTFPHISYSYTVTVTANTNYHELLDFIVGSPLFAGSLEEYSIENNDLLDSDHSAIKTIFEFEKKIVQLKSTLKKRLNFSKTVLNLRSIH